LREITDCGFRGWDWRNQSRREYPIKFLQLVVNATDAAAAIRVLTFSISEFSLCELAPHFCREAFENKGIGTNITGTLQIVHGIPEVGGRNLV
jgi:hypothetical protein